MRRLLMIGFALVAMPLSAQTEIVVSGSGSVEVPPDFAEVQLGVTSQSDSPRIAADSLDGQLDRLVGTLTELGFDVDSLRSRSFSVAPVRNAIAGGTITGYSASASVTLRIPDLERLPDIVQRALEAGATNVSRVQFRTTRQMEYRAEALQRAMESARRDAEIIAEAQGRALGELLEVTTQPGGGGSIMLRGPSTVPGLSAVLSPELITISARVGMRWQLGNSPD